MGATPKAAKSRILSRPDDAELGIWVDSVLIAKLHSQPSSNLFRPTAPNGSAHLLHFADLALGVVKADKFKSKKVSKTRKTE
jgi:hypothetical protein